MAKNKSVIVVGGGIVGLSTAYFLHKAGHQVTLLDKSDIRNLKQSFNFKKIINLGAFVPKSQLDYESSINIQNKQIVSNLITNYNCDLFHISTYAIYENTNSQFFNEETEIIYPKSAYAIS